MSTCPWRCWVQPNSILLSAAPGLAAAACALLGSLLCWTSVLAGAASTGGETGRFLLLAGEPIGEPVARYGPFVMNSDQELGQAIDDYRNGRMGEIDRV